MAVITDTNSRAVWTVRCTLTDVPLCLTRPVPFTETGALLALAVELTPQFSNTGVVVRVLNGTTVIECYRCYTGCSGVQPSLDMIYTVIYSLYHAPGDVFSSAMRLEVLIRACFLTIYYTDPSRKPGLYPLLTIIY